MERGKTSKSQESILWRKKVIKKKEAREKGTWAQRKGQSAPPREAHLVRTCGMAPGLQGHIPCASMAE